MTAQWYVHDILQPYVLPLMQRLPEAIFRQDNARPHTARASQDCLRTVTTVLQLARSPDLFPIEHIWDHLGRVGDLVIESISILERASATVFSEPCPCRMTVEYWEIKSK
ncbi:transposable element Tcb2 transposase [Trichonephila clavipes]|nr:transposable element Tcb2 transposase [Trichonephila clavipes]